MEKVNTGGTVSFQYSKGHQLEASPELRREIADAWVVAEKRIARERRTKIIISLIIALVIIAIGFGKYFGFY